MRLRFARRPESRPGPRALCFYAGGFPVSRAAGPVAAGAHEATSNARLRTEFAPPPAQARAARPGMPWGPWPSHTIHINFEQTLLLTGVGALSGK